MRVVLAGVAFRLNLPAAALAALRRTPFASAESEAPAALTWTFRHERLTRPRPFSDPERFARFEEEGKRLVLCNGQWAELAPEHHEGIFHLDAACESGDELAVLAPISSFLRLLLAWELPALGGLVLHASSVVDGDEAHVFYGESGAGKSTVCTLAQERLLLGDEITVIRHDTEGFRVYPAPFFADDERTRRAARAYPLAGLHALVQAPADAVEPLATTAALPGFLRCVLNLDDRPEMAARLLDLSLALGHTIGFSRLCFTPTPAFWPRLAAVVPRQRPETQAERVARVIREEVAIVPYDPAWPARFAEEAENLRRLLPAGLLVRLDHVGSTSVPGMWAKPIVDILVEVTSLDRTRAEVMPLLAALGYDVFWRPSDGDDGPPFYAWFIKRDAAGTRTHHVHMVEAGYPQGAMRRFREALLARPALAADYAALKRELAAQHGDDRLAYHRGKSAFIRRVMAELGEEP